MTIPLNGQSLQVSTLSTERVLPAQDAPNAPAVPASVPLDGQDMAMPQMYIHHCLFFFSSTNPALEKLSLEEAAEALRVGLRPFLAQFPSAAGQLRLSSDEGDEKERGLWHLDHDGQGAELLLATSPLPLGDAWKGRGGQLDSDLSPRGVQVTQASDPVFALKLTRFACGSLCLSTSVHHWVVDFGGLYDMMVLLAQCMSDPTVTLPHRDFGRHAARMVQGVEPRAIPTDIWYKERPLTSAAGMPTFTRTPESCSNVMLHVSAAQLAQLKADLTAAAAQQENAALRPSKERWISSFDALHAALWASVTQARGLNGDAPTKLHTPVDARPYIPGASSYVGNLHPGHVLLLRAGDLQDTATLFNVAVRIRQEHVTVDPATMAGVIAHHNSNVRSGYLPNLQAMFGDDVTVSNVSKFDWGGLRFGALGHGDATSSLGIPPAVWGKITVAAADGTAFIVPAAPALAPDYKPAGEDDAQPPKRPGVVVMMGLRNSDHEKFCSLPLVKQYMDVMP